MVSQELLFLLFVSCITFKFFVQILSSYITSGYNTNIFTLIMCFFLTLRLQHLRNQMFRIQTVVVHYFCCFNQFCITYCNNFIYQLFNVIVSDTTCKWWYLSMCYCTCLKIFCFFCCAV